MVFKKIEIYGLKSFADKAIISFEDGVTGIVGPNGCGKSNVADAIRWGLGEKSSKTLRIDEMCDVVFKGTEKRKGHSYAEVSIYLNNNKRTFACDKDELVITRKIYVDKNEKKSKSEYFINRESCKHRDIINLMKDTGLAREGYSIIGQGKVEELINSKPEDRRKIFEEAAGIGRHKADRKDSLNRLDRTLSDIERCKISMAEKRERLEPLTRQAKKTRKYNELYSQLKLIEINNFIYQQENSYELKNVFQKKIDAFSEEIQIKNDRINNADRRYSKLNMEINNADMLIKRLNEEKTEILVQHERLTGDGKALNERLKSLRQEHARVSESILFYKEKKADTQRKSDTVAQDLADASLTYGLKKSELDALENKFNSIAKEISNKETEIEESNRSRIEDMDKLANLKTDLAGLIKEREFTASKLAETHINIERLKLLIDEERERNENLQRATEKLERERNKLNKEIRQLRAQSETNNKELRELLDEADKYNRMVITIKSRIATLDDVKKNYENFAPAIQMLLRDARNDYKIKSKILGVIADIISVPEEYGTAINIALGKASQNIVTEDKEDTKFLIDYLKMKKYGRIDFMPLNFISAQELENKAILGEFGCLGSADSVISYDKRYKNAIINLLGRTLVFKDYDSATAAFTKYGNRYRIVTLEGERLNAGGVISGGSSDSRGVNLLSQTQNIEQLKSSLTSNEKMYAVTKEKYAALDEDNKQLIARLKEYETQMNESGIEYNTLTQKENVSGEALEKYSKDLINSNDNVEKLEKNLKIITSMIDKSSKETDNIATSKELEAVIAEQRRAFEDKKNLRDSLYEELSNAKVEFTALDGQIQSHKSNAERYASEVSDCDKLLKSLGENADKLTIDINNVQKDMTGKILSDDDKKKVDDIKAKLDDYEARKEEMKAEQSEINKSSDGVRAELDIIYQKRASAAGKLESLDENMRSLASHIADEYRLTYEEALRYKVEEFKYDATGSATKKVKREIADLGDINTLAIAECEELQADYDIKSVILADLENTEKNLREIIDRLSYEMTKKFDSKFKEIQENFTITFREIFGGGEGKLELMESDDPLEAGIEIFAQPPGKKLDTLTPLSGGEKALTAISILFAILRLKPMPFCVLDEIEAALDDSNVTLFANYLKKYARKTQFIVVTHRKPTMELADKLFGVTMQEAGVSKIVSINLSDAAVYGE